MNQARIIWNTESFIKKANEVHNNKYDYSCTKYSNSKELVKIKCNQHGIFCQIPYSHLKGIGCRKCYLEQKAKKQLSTTDEFIKKSKQIHVDKYDYSSVNYKRSNLHVTIICKLHGEFSQKPNDHLSGKGCKSCGYKSAGLKNSELMTRDHYEFIKLANIVHNNKYDYSLTKYINRRTKITILCNEHGQFDQIAGNHMAGAGCPKCSKLIASAKCRNTLDEFIKIANLTHNNYYSYEESIYKTNKTKIKIKCPKHGLFEQAPNNHMLGAGCPKCVGISSKIENKWLDLIGVPNTPQNRQVSLIINGKKVRVDGFIPETKTIYEFYGNFWHGNPKMYSPNDINPINKKSFGELYLKTLDKEKFIVDYGYNLITIWEKEFRDNLKSS